MPGGGGGPVGGGDPFGGGGAHFGGGGGHFGGGHFGGGHFAGGGRPHFGGGAHFGGGRPAIRSAARPSFRAKRSFAGRGHSNPGVNRHAMVNRNPGVPSGRNRTATFNSSPRANAHSRAVRKVLASSAVAGALHN